MPLVLTAGAPTASGHSYADVPGVRHAYPRAYRRMMQPGTPFVYYRGRRAASIGLPGPSYFGCGILGTITESGDPELVAEILDFVEFESPVPLLDSTGRYFEEGAYRNASYWRRGVRPIDDTTLARILSVGSVPPGPGDATADAPSTPPISGRSRGKTGPAQYARDADLLAAVERYAVDVALKTLRSQYGEKAVEEMPRNNPGFDIRVTTADADLHVEVKGTRQAHPVFFLSEGERAHSEQMTENYRLCVVSAIDLAIGTHRVRWHDGIIDAANFELRPRQWTVRFVDSSRASP